MRNASSAAKRLLLVAAVVILALYAIVQAINRPVGGDVETYRALRESKWAEILYNIVKYRKTLTDVVHTFCVVNTFAGVAGKFDAWTQKAVVAVQSTGGDTKGMNMPYNIHWTGERTYGTFDLDTLTFTPAGSAPAGA